MRSRRYGELDVLVDVSSTALAHQLAADARELPGVVDAVPAARTLLVRCAGSDVAARLAEELAALAEPTLRPRTEPGRLVTIEVTYDGEDLADVAHAAGLGVGEVVVRHTAVTYEAAFAGFAPGFVYLTGLDPALTSPRRSTPRTRVPAGSVAVASDLTAVYPRSSPGGWNLLGRTDAVLLDLDRERPALVEPGDRVRFVVAGGRP